MRPSGLETRETGGIPSELPLAMIRQCKLMISHLIYLISQQSIMWHFIAQAITGLMLLVSNCEVLILS